MILPVDDFNMTYEDLKLQDFSEIHDLDNLIKDLLALR